MNLCGNPESVESVLALYLHHLVVQVSVTYNLIALLVFRLITVYLLQYIHEFLGKLEIVK